MQSHLSPYDPQRNHQLTSALKAHRNYRFDLNLQLTFTIHDYRNHRFDLHLTTTSPFFSYGFTSLKTPRKEITNKETIRITPIFPTSLHNLSLWLETPISPFP